jgi:hypothetical protein
VVVADLIREDTGFLAATLMGIALGNQALIDPSRRIDVSGALGFQATLVQLLVGVLFVLIAASVSTGDVEAVLPEALVLVAVMAFLIRPAAVLLATLRSRFTWRERAFVAWMAPRGIVAGATASAFGLQLAQEGTAGAEDVLPIVFIAIFGTVVLYGLTAPLAARALGLAGKQRVLALVVGGQPWARDLAAALKQSGVAVRMWVGAAEDRAAALEAGLDADRGRMMVGALDREAELEEITDALLLTRSDDFNSVAAADLRGEVGNGHVYRVAPDLEEPDLLPPSIEAGILGNSSLTFAELTDRFAAGARFVTRNPDENPLSDDPRTELLLFAVTSRGRLRVATDGHAPDVRTGDTMIVLLSPL